LIFVRGVLQLFIRLTGPIISSLFRFLDFRGRDSGLAADSSSQTVRGSMNIENSELSDWGGVLSSPPVKSMNRLLVRGSCLGV